MNLNANTDKARSSSRNCKMEWLTNKKNKSVIDKITTKRKIDQQVAEYWFQHCIWGERCSVEARSNGMMSCDAIRSWETGGSILGDPRRQSGIAQQRWRNKIVTTKPKRGSSRSKTAKPRDVRTDRTADPRSVPFLTISGNGGARRKSLLGL